MVNIRPKATVAMIVYDNFKRDIPYGFFDNCPQDLGWGVRKRGLFFEKKGPYGPVSLWYFGKDVSYNQMTHYSGSRHAGQGSNIGKLKMS